MQGYICFVAHLFFDLADQKLYLCHQGLQLPLVTVLLRLEAHRTIQGEKVATPLFPLQTDRNQT